MTVVYPKDLDAGNLKSKFDVLSCRPARRFAARAARPADVAVVVAVVAAAAAPIPAEFQKMQGR